MKKRRFFFCFPVLLLCGAVCLDASGAEDWAFKAAQAVGQAARGNPQGALSQAVPGASTLLPGQTQVYAGPGGAGLRQPFLSGQPLQRVPVSLQGAYNLYAASNGYGFPSLGHNVQVSAAGGPVQNTTTWTPSAPKLRKSR